MARRGRKRKEGKRTPTGQLSRAKDAGTEHVQRQRVWHKLMNDAKSESIESWVGVLKDSGFLEQIHEDAARRYEQLCRRYKRIFGVDLIQRTTGVMDPMRRGQSIDPEPAHDEIQSVRSEYDAVYEAMSRAHIQELRHVVLQGNKPEDRYVLREALDIVKDKLGLESKESDRRRKRTGKWNEEDYKPSVQPDEFYSQDA